MVWQVTKVLLAALVISFTSWLAGRQPKLAGFLMALPLSSMIALALFFGEYRDPEKAAAFARGIFTAVPLSLLFFVPFLFAQKLPFGFWTLYVSGVALLFGGFLFHRALF